MTFDEILPGLLLLLLLLAALAYLAAVVRLDGLGHRPPPAGRHPYFPESGPR